MSEITHDGWTLVHIYTNKPVTVGEVIPDFRGDSDAILGGAPPHKPSSTGRVYTAEREFFPSVYNLKWEKTSNV